MEEFFTRQKANEGIRFPLEHPDGSPSDHWLTILGVDSDAFRNAERDQKRKFVSLKANMDAIENPDEKEKFLLDVQTEMEIDILASLVSGWSFDKPCTFENVRTFLKEAPQIADAINEVSAKRRVFFTKGLNGSGSSSGGKPKSASHPKAVQPRKKSTSSRSGK